MSKIFYSFYTSLKDNCYGQCGVDTKLNENFVRNFTPVAIEEKIIDVFCGWYHTFFIAEDGSTYACGW